jgi:hypothetical protein
VQLRIPRAYYAHGDDAVLSTRQLAEWTHPRLDGLPYRLRRNACRAIRRAAPTVGLVRAGRRWPDGVLWRLR